MTAAKNGVVLPADMNVGNAKFAMQAIASEQVCGHE
jgi:hypothetical protein